MEEVRATVGDISPIGDCASCMNNCGQSKDYPGWILCCAACTAEEVINRKAPGGCSQFRQRKGEPPRPHSAPKAPAVWKFVGGTLTWQLPEDDPLRTFACDATILALEAVDVLVARQRDYGAYNISQMGEAGLLVRLNDKLQRRLNLALSGAAPTSEAVDDTDIDISNYALIARMGRHGKWPVPFRKVTLRLEEDG